MKQEIKMKPLSKTKIKQGREILAKLSSAISKSINQISLDPDSYNELYFETLAMMDYEIPPPN